MRKTRPFLISIFIALLGMGGLFFNHLAVLQAAELDESTTVNVNCYGITVETEGKGAAADRNTSGTGFETIRLEVKDGAGNIVFSYSELLNVEGNETISFESHYDFSSEPLFNPLVARIYSPAGNGFPEQELLNVTRYCRGLQLYVAPGGGGPGIPSGFVLSTITCNVPVFNTPSGSPVAGSTIISGQTWYVNPEVAMASDGSSWTEIFTSSTINGYVPTACVS